MKKIYNGMFLNYIRYNLIRKITLLILSGLIVCSYLVFNLYIVIFTMIFIILNLLILHKINKIQKIAYLKNDHHYNIIHNVDDIAKFYVQVDIETMINEELYLNVNITDYIISHKIKSVTIITDKYD